MPFEKVTVTHKFGIISQKHKANLQRLFERDRRENEQKNSLRRNEDETLRLQITEDFVKLYNESSLMKRLKLDQQCWQIIEKIKKKINSAKTDDLDIQLSWAELSQLCQCKSPFREECIDLLILSLKHARLSDGQIPTLFFLAETVIYWIRTDIIDKPLLRSFELKLLKVSYMVFQRIYFHHLEESLESQEDLKSHLSLYLQGFDAFLEAYSPYPDAYLCMTFMIRIGELIRKQHAVPSAATNVTNDTKKGHAHFGSPPRKEDFFSILAHSVVLYNFIQHSDRNLLQLTNYLSKLIEISKNINVNNWIGCSLAFYIICECAKLDVHCMNAFLLISTTGDDEREVPDSSRTTQLMDNWGWELSCLYVEMLADICICQSSSAIIKKKTLLGFHQDAIEALKPLSATANLKGYGLVDTARFRLRRRRNNDNQRQDKVESVVTDRNNDDDWSWKVRYSSLKALVRICKVLDKDHEELKQMCWSCLVVLEADETDRRVLEAIKVGQINEGNNLMTPKPVRLTSRSKLATTSPSSSNQDPNQLTSIYCQMAVKLNPTASLMSPNEAERSGRDGDNRAIGDLENKSKTSKDTIQHTESKSLDSKGAKYSKMPITMPAGNAHKRTTLREELLLSKQFLHRIPSYSTRTSIDLMRIVEDQYRKEVLEMFDNEYNAVNANFSAS